MGSVNKSYPTLLTSVSGHPANRYGSVNGSFLSSEAEQAIMEGASVPGRMSASRRFFILLSVFDVLFTFLVWIICIMVSGNGTISHAFSIEVLSYSIRSSLFDITMLALGRFALIVVFYAVIKISHWWVIALTTAGSGAFIIAKVFLYDWTHSDRTASVVLLLCSFVLSWGEAWFLDFRVIPSESKASEYLVAKEDPERVPVLPHANLTRSHSDDGSAFYSPPASDGEEEINEKENDGSTVSEVEWLSPKSSGDGASKTSPEEYKRLAEEALETAMKIIHSEGWVREKADGDDIIYSKHIQSHGKVFQFVGVLNSNADKVIDELYFKCDEMHKWNPTVKKARVIQTIDDHVDITHVIAAEGAAGLVASRDFVNVRIWKKRNNSYIHATIGVTHPDIPVTGKYVRGEQGPCVYMLSPMNGDSNKCMLRWLLITNLKGWLPQYLIDQTLSTVMMDYVNALRKQVTVKEGA